MNTPSLLLSLFLRVIPHVGYSQPFAGPHAQIPNTIRCYNKPGSGGTDSHCAGRPPPRPHLHNPRLPRKIPTTWPIEFPLLSFFQVIGGPPRSSGQPLSIGWANTGITQSIGGILEPVAFDLLLFVRVFPHDGYSHNLLLFVRVIPHDGYSQGLVCPGSPCH